MGRYDDISPEELRTDLRRFAELILRLEKDDQLLAASPRILKVLGELRAKLFAYEVRFTGRLLPRDATLREPTESERLVQEALQRARESEREWTRGLTPPDESD